MRLKASKSSQGPLTHTQASRQGPRCRGHVGECRETALWAKESSSWGFQHFPLQEIIPGGQLTVSTPAGSRAQDSDSDLSVQLLPTIWKAPCGQGQALEYIELGAGVDQSSSFTEALIPVGKGFSGVVNVGRSGRIPVSNLLPSLCKETQNSLVTQSEFWQNHAMVCSWKLEGKVIDLLLPQGRNFSSSGQGKTTTTKN